MTRRVAATVILAALMLPFTITPADAATNAEIDQAIQDGLAWLATQQNGDGSFGWVTAPRLAATAAAVLAFENEGHFPGGGTAYADEVEQGLDYIFELIKTQSIGPQAHGDPDTNGNGRGIYFVANSMMYETGMVMQAIVASNTPERTVPYYPPGNDYVAVAGGANHSLALRADGSLFGWGYNGYGETNVPAGNDFVAIAAGDSHSIALRADGSLAGWGSNGYGRASVPAGNDYVAIAADYYHNLALKADGSLVRWGRNYFGYQDVPAGNDYAAIAAGLYHGLAIKTDGSLVGWGFDAYGETNVPAGNDYVAIAAGDMHSLALKADGSLVGWGKNFIGQVNVPAGNDHVAIAAGKNHNLALRADGSLVSWGYNGYGQTSVPAGNNFGAIAAGWQHSLAVRTDGSVTGWGHNEYQQAGATLGGLTYYEVMEDMVDWLAWGQLDTGTGRGAWNYSPNTSYGDNSVTQWPVLGLVAAEQWGIEAPSFVKPELSLWIDYVQNDASGGSGYTTPNDLVNISKTGGLLVEMFYVGDDATTDRAQHALSYIDTRWNVGPSGYYGNRGQPYAMFSVFKGLELMQVPTIPSAPANEDTLAGDWWGDYADHLVSTQTGPGAWNGFYYWNTWLATSWNIVILQASVFPVSVDIAVPTSACDETGYDISVHYSVERFEADGTLSVFKDDVLYDTVTLTDFQGTGLVEYTVASDDTGANDWRAELDVTGGGITVHAEDNDSGTVYDTPDVSDIPNQTVPFEPIDLDDYQTCDCATVDWSVEGVPAGWTVEIDAENVATVTPPEGTTDPAAITFVATFHWPGIDCVGSDVAIFSVNQPPVAMAGPGLGYPYESYAVDEGGSVVVNGTQSYDPDGDEITFAWDLDGDEVFESPGATTPFSAAGLDNPETDHVYVYLLVCDEHDACSLARARVDILDLAPTAAFSWPSAPQLEGSPVPFTDGSTSTVDEIVSWSWDFAGLGTSIDPNPSFAFPDNGTYNVCLTVEDDDGSTDTVCQDVTVDNVAPTIEDIGVPWATPVDIDDQATFSVDVTFSDPAGMTDEPYTCAFDLDYDGETFSADATGTFGYGSCGTALDYAGPGVYTVMVEVTDKDGGSDSAVATEFIVVYDADGGFVTGGGWIYSVAGNYAPDPTAEGKANFGFVSKYKKGTSVPEGNTEFQFKAGSLNFHASDYDWLVIAGQDKAKYKGTGTINGAGSYGFMLTAVDNGNSGDTFRIKIWDKNAGNGVVYDNKMGVGDDLYDGTAIGGGNIKVHKK